ncbi:MULTISPECIES: hypothetical protein [unclassified Streptomyces]|uniref:hypothetical protein n=1 Tax=unclassified Streptomyces TaxID=2593676 RepID=UPI0037FCA474
MTFPEITPEAAYAEAPPIARETVALLRLRRELGDGRPAYFPPAGVHEIREVLLREAALVDRLTQDEPAAPDALQVAAALRDFDAEGGTGPGATFEGTVPPWSPRWTEDARGYVRLEYHRWLTTPPWKPPVIATAEQYEELRAAMVAVEIPHGFDRWHPNEITQWLTDLGEDETIPEADLARAAAAVNWALGIEPADLEGTA